MSLSIQAVSFDVGGTLIEPWPSVGHVYAEVAEESGLPRPDPELLTSQFFQAWQERASFGYCRQDWAEVVKRSFHGILPRAAVTAIFPQIYERFIEARSWHLYDDVLVTLQTLRDRGLRLAVTSNWDERLVPTLRSLGLLKHFEVVTASGPLGHHKPSAEIFHRTCQSLQLSPSAVLHVGDSRREDLEGAVAAGLHSLLLRRNQPVEQLQDMGSLHELSVRLESLKRT